MGFKYIGGNCGGAKKIGDGWFKKFANGEMGSKKSSGWVGIVQFTICHLGQFGAVGYFLSVESESLLCIYGLSTQ